MAKLIYNNRELSCGGGLSREAIPAYNKQVKITTSGTFTATVSGWHKFTIKGAGGGGSGGTTINSSQSAPGYGGGEGGTTFAYEKMNAGDTAAITIGAGGTGGPKTNGASTASRGQAGGNSSVYVNSTTYTAGGGGGGGSYVDADDTGGVGGTGTIHGCPGCSATGGYAAGYSGGAGGGNGGANGHLTASGVAPRNGVDGGGGAGGYAAQVYTYTSKGSNCGNGVVWVEYFDYSLN